MTKHFFFTCIPILLLVFTNDSIAQQTNSTEDYSAYLPEVRVLNQKLAHGEMPPPDSAAKIIIKPSVKYIQGPAGNLPIRIFKPDTVRAVVLDIHGGGWQAGNAAVDDNLNDEMARICKVAVVSVDYRLATPENPFPACITDCNACCKMVSE